MKEEMFREIKLQPFRLKVRHRKRGEANVEEQSRLAGYPGQRHASILFSQQHRRAEYKGMNNSIHFKRRFFVANHASRENDQNARFIILLKNRMIVPLIDRSD